MYQRAGAVRQLRRGERATDDRARPSVPARRTWWTPKSLTRASNDACRPAPEGARGRRRSRSTPELQVQADVEELAASRAGRRVLLIAQRTQALNHASARPARSARADRGIAKFAKELLPADRQPRARRTQAAFEERTAAAGA